MDALEIPLSDLPKTYGTEIVNIFSPLDGKETAQITYATGSIAIKVAAALVAGFAIILKPSEFTSWQAQIIMDCINAAGLPAGVVKMINSHCEINTKPIMTSIDITKISFTGSSLVVKILTKHAIDTIKRGSLELGEKTIHAKRSWTLLD